MDNVNELRKMSPELTEDLNMHRDSHLPSKAEIFAYWKERIFEKGLFVDWGEPSCWVCGFYYESKYDISSPNTPLEPSR